MRIDQPSFSGSITQDVENAYSNLSGSFTGSFTGSLTGELDVEQATFRNLEVEDTLLVGTDSGSGTQLQVTGSVDSTEGYSVDGTDVLDTSLAYAIALG